jgi:Family of unknown function (DUF5519)
MREALLQRIRSLSSVAVSEGAFAPGEAVWVGTREIAHFDAAGTFDIRYTRERIRLRRRELRADPRVVLRSGTSDWIEVTLRSEGDVDFALTLLDDAIAANRLTARPGPPPAGRELERRRRFH